MEITAKQIIAAMASFLELEYESHAGDFLEKHPEWDSIEAAIDTGGMTTDNLVTDFDFDSLDPIEMVTHIEEECKVTFPNNVEKLLSQDDVTPLKTVAGQMLATLTS